MSRLTIQPCGLKHADDSYQYFYIDVPEGSELLDIIAEFELHPAVRYTAWCVVDGDLPWTRRFFDFLMPGSHIKNRADLVYVGYVKNVDEVWLVFENKAKRLAWLEETIK